MFDETIDIKTLSERTGISVRQIRYVLDHELVPERNWMADETAIGRARVFGAISGVLIACAAYLLQAGYKREGVRALISAVSLPRGKGRRNSLGWPIIADLLAFGYSGQVQFADGRYVRWIINQEFRDWFDSQVPSNTPTNLIPKVVVEINVSAIRDQIIKRTLPA